MMKKFIPSKAVILLAAIILPLNVIACGPSPQKVTKEIVIKAGPEQVWAIVSDFGAMHKWHPHVIGAVLERKSDSDGKETSYRTLKLKEGGTIIQKQRETQAGEMKLGVVMIQGDIAASNYSDALTVKTGHSEGETIVTWVGRFNNKANAMQAPVGQDNASAIESVERWYDVGMLNLKRVIEASH
ncbi:MAG: SRPBCC family protein [Methylotenera sp.]|nr:SRPBCC family protein [Methylotenera sp.]MDP3094641.1 SRPBCC family protein [Methylotenera sp.]MDZ4223786.1 SRPBCC family protein [Methylotenera sp.]